MNEIEGFPQGIEVSHSAAVEHLRYWMDTATPLSAQLRTMAASVSVVLSGVVKSLEPIKIQAQNGSENFLQCNDWLMTKAALHTTTQSLSSRKISLALLFSDGTVVVISPLHLR